MEYKQILTTNVSIYGVQASSEEYMLLRHYLEWLRTHDFGTYEVTTKKAKIDGITRRTVFVKTTDSVMFENV